MSKFAVVDNVNGTFKVESEWDDKQSALVAFHDRCKILWNASDVIKASVRILDDNMNVYDAKIEDITHEQPES